MKKTIALSILALLFIGGGFGFYLYNKKPADTREASSDFSLSAVDLLKEFTADENEATKKYTDKVLEISGKVTSVDQATSTVFLDAEDAMAAVTCSFYAEEATSLTTVKPGDFVKIKGKCTGKLMDVVLNQCSIIH